MGWYKGWNPITLRCWVPRIARSGAVSWGEFGCDRLSAIPHALGSFCVPMPETGGGPLFPVLCIVLVAYVVVAILAEDGGLGFLTVPCHLPMPKESVFSNPNFNYNPCYRKRHMRLLGLTLEV